MVAHLICRRRDVHGTRFISLASRPAVLLLSAFLASLLAISGLPASSSSASAQGTVRIEWLGNLFYRITSPQGVVILTSPQLVNAGGAVALEELERTDLILVPNSHPDDMGSPIEIAALSGAAVVAPRPLGEWLVENGLDRSQLRTVNIGSGTLLSLRDVSIVPATGAHDNTLADGRDGGPTASYFVIIENGPTIFYSGHGTLTADLALYAEAYQPDIAIIGLNQVREFPLIARLMTTGNPRLRTVIPSHRVPGDPVLFTAMEEMDRLGLGHLWFMPAMRQVYEL
jgi:L-ascorbate metabolism protein UlaG (beta-lactamase superfamily)